ncbi:MAG: helix-turn-helix transcriptional regulator [Rectinemataceae bacterium]
MASLRENLALNLKIRRSILGISQAELAERAGISPGYVGGLETKRNWPSDDKAELLAKALGVDPGLLFMDPNSEGIMFDLKDLDMVLSRSHDQILQDVERAYGMRSIPAPGNGNGNANGNAGSGRNR